MTRPAADLAGTTELQRKASHPKHSAWVRANAGSGKTYVLAQRVVRLLLDGVPPSKILCLTFTKAAAANMSIRIFDRLAKWATLDDAELRREIEETGAAVPQKLDDARRLFVRTVETPGGLKVQTIHAFCERLLHLFPFEANVAARFEAMDEETAAVLLDDARQTVLRGETNNGGEALRQAVAFVANEIGSAQFDDLLRQVVAKTHALRAAATLQSNGLRDEIGRRLGLAPGEDSQSIVDEILFGGPSETERRTLAQALDAGSKTDKERAAELLASLSNGDSAIRVEAYFSCFFKKDGDPRERLGTKAIANDVLNRLRSEQSRLITLREKQRAAYTLDRTLALYRIGEAARAHYEHAKAARGYLDFDDLIERTWTLLSRFDADWILFKLDAGIDHILVDEAQDTSPVQWKILKKLTEEFFAGKGARPGTRTFFAVGDEKQSIYSFQGAAPHEFGLNRTYFAKHVERAKLAFADVELKESFRSSQVILDGVDAVFAIAEHRAGLSVDDDAPTAHHARKHAMPGCIELWPLVQKQDSVEPEDWRLPVDILHESEPPAVMARLVADKIGVLLDPANRHAVHDKDGVLRPVDAGDILVLVRSRGPFFGAVIRALKERAIPVAGADRLNIMDHIAVMDLCAAGRTALLPDDDLSLATVLKSPLIGLDDNDLIAIAPHRKGSLFQALCASEEFRHAQAAETIKAWRTDARRMTPFEFYAALLGVGGGRKALLSRLGPEANDAIDEFLRIALDADAPDSATLVQFLERLERADVEIKRDMEAAASAVRVMTVHGAKGLEAKIVFLPDTCSAESGRHSPQLLDLASTGEDAADLFVWRKNKGSDPDALDAAMTDLQTAEAEEHRRLLYVALTRAEERLYIGGFHGPRGQGKGCWYSMLSTSLGSKGEAVPGPAKDMGEARRIGAETLLPAGASPTAEPTPQPSAVFVPGWLTSPAAPERAPDPPVRPSTALASADQPDSARADADAPGTGSGGCGAFIGTLAHELLYRLPGVAAGDRAAAAERYLAARGTQLPEAVRDDIAARVLAVIEMPFLAPLFGPGSRAEVAIAGRLKQADGSDMAITGRIDRIYSGGSEVLLADFKTGASRPADKTPPAYVRQMALYRAVLEPLFPGKPIKTLIIWTGGPDAVEIPSAMLDASLAVALRRPSEA